jgi:acyl carrier protein
MVPNAFVELDRLPLTPSGKVDRRALPAPHRGSPDLASDFVAAVTQVERTIVDVWADVLGVERIGLNDNFFDLGGHSLLATQAVVRLRSRLSVDLGVRDLFQAPTPNRLAHRVQQLSTVRAADEPPLARGIATEPIPVSFGQERILFLDQSQPGSALYNLSDIYPIAGRFDQAALERSLSELCRRHESLRTTFQVVQGRPVQVIGDASPVTLPVVDLSREPNPEAAASARSIEEGQRPFDLARGPLFRAVAFRLNSERHQVQLTMHHIITDGWSINVIRRELQILYDAFTVGQRSPLEDLPVRYADYAAWQRQRMEGPLLTRQLSFWKQQLMGAPHAVRLLTDRPQPSVPSHRGATQSRLVTAELAEGLRRVAQAHGASLFMTLFAAFSLLLNRESAERDLVIGVAVANRSRPELEGVVGLFANLLALRIEVDGRERFEQLLGRVREVTLGAYEHQELPYEKLVETLRPERARSFNPLFNVAFSHNASEPSAPVERVPAVAGVPANDDDTVIESGASRYDLVLATADAPEGFRISFDYSTDLFDDATVRRMLGDLLRLLEEIVG